MTCSAALRAATSRVTDPHHSKEGKLLNVPEALHAIATTGDGYCWYCDHKLPRRGEKAVRDGWDVQRIPGERVASIILVCPACLDEKEKLGEEGFLRNLSSRLCNTTC